MGSASVRSGHGAEYEVPEVIPYWWLQLADEDVWAGLGSMTEYLEAEEEDG